MQYSLQEWIPEYGYWLKSEVLNMAYEFWKHKLMSRSSHIASEAIKENNIKIGVTKAKKLRSPHTMFYLVTW